MLSLLTSIEATAGILSPPVGSPTHVVVLECSVKGHKNGKGLEHLPHQERLRELTIIHTPAHFLFREVVKNEGMQWL